MRTLVADPVTRTFPDSTAFDTARAQLTRTARRLGLDATRDLLGQSLREFRFIILIPAALEGQITAATVSLVNPQVRVIAGARDEGRHRPSDGRPRLAERRRIPHWCGARRRSPQAPGVGVT